MTAPGETRQTIVAVLVDVVLPLACYYALRAFDVSETTALVVSGLPPALRVAATFARTRRLDAMGLFVVLLVLLNLGTAAITGDARLLLVRGGWLSLLVAGWLLGSLVLGGRPVTYLACRSLLPGKAGHLDHLWETRASFRRIWRLLTVLWGGATLLGCALNIVAAYTLPVDVVPALDTGWHIGSFVVLQIVTQILLRGEGTLGELWHSPKPSHPTDQPT
ncbi:VC0807 family protein [Amycolatopsis minnesotensis]|uniref:VC0807 family protein n=1 Tax=Amycolatopsis minnesotensis TaxID=337894 RepID=UPI0031E1DD83